MILTFLLFHILSHKKYFDFQSVKLKCTTVNKNNIYISNCYFHKVLMLYKCCIITDNHRIYSTKGKENLDVQTI